MSEDTRWWRRGTWDDDPEFHVPSADPGIPFRVKACLVGTHSRRVSKKSAAAVAAGFVLRVVEQTVLRYDALCVDAASVAANAACSPKDFDHPGVRITTVGLTVEVEPGQQEEARRLAILRRIAEIGGREAVIKEATEDIKTSTKYVAPDNRWLRVAEAMDRLARNSDTDDRKDTILSLADWAKRHDRDLSQALESAASEVPPSFGRNEEAS